MEYGKNWNPASYYQDDSVAANYDRQRFTSLAGRVFDRLEKRVLGMAFAGVATGAVIGDVPCGTGRLAESLLGQGFRVLGIDISPQMLSVARGKLARFGDRFQSRVCDARALAQEGIRFDAALCARVLMHFPLAEQIQFLRNVAQVTSGRIVFTQGLNTPYHRLRRMAKRLLGHQNPAVYPVTPAELDRLIREAGLREVRRYRVVPIISEAVIVVTERAA
ncbi:MAG TPA: methyltransferase domain-containing protein [Stellaceae bacterium]